MMILPPVPVGSDKPALLLESVWLATWFLLGLALLQFTRQGKTIDAQTRTAV